MCVYIILLLFCSGVSSQFNFFKSPEESENKNDWVDPNDSFFSKMSGAILNLGKMESSFISKSEDQGPGEATACPVSKPDACISYLSRFVSIILRNTGLKYYKMQEKESTKVVTVDISVTKKTLDTLQKFSAGEKLPYNELDECFVTFFEVSNRNPNSRKDDESWNSFFLLDKRLILGLILTGLITKACLFIKSTLTMRHLFYTLVLMVYFVCVGQSLWAQYEDAYARRIISLEESMDGHGNIKIPDACFPDRLKFWDRMKYNLFWSENPCTRYMNSKKSMFSEININEAFMKPFYGLLFEAIPNLGQTAGKGLKTFSELFGFPLNIILPLAIPYMFFSNFFPASLQFFKLLMSRGLPYYSRSRGMEGESRPELPQSATTQSSVSTFHISGSTVTFSSCGRGPSLGIQPAVLAPGDITKPSCHSCSPPSNTFNEIVQERTNKVRTWEQKQKANPLRSHKLYLKNLKHLREQKHLTSSNPEFN